MLTHREHLKRGLTDRIIDHLSMILIVGGLFIGGLFIGKTSMIPFLFHTFPNSDGKKQPGIIPVWDLPCLRPLSFNCWLSHILEFSYNSRATPKSSICVSDFPWNKPWESARPTRALCRWNGAAAMEAEWSGGEWLFCMTWGWKGTWWFSMWSTKDNHGIIIGQLWDSNEIISWHMSGFALCWSERDHFSMTKVLLQLGILFRNVSWF